MQKSYFNVRQRFLMKFFVIGVLAFIVVYIFNYDFSKNGNVNVGVTFSKSYTQQLGLNWQQAYLAILDDLEVKNIRLIAQWDEIEPEFLSYDFADLEWQINQAELRDVQVILAVGRRVPRWPECHDPKWIEKLESSKVNKEVLRMIKDVVEHFKKYDNIVMWQVENEPFLDFFGECPVISVNQVKQEIALVQSLDKRPVMVTDSGEMSSWVKTAGLADKFGHTVYRVVYNDFLGYLHYYLPPAFYYSKAKAVGLKSENVIVAELQAEPWVPKGYTLQLDYQTMIKLMSPQKVQDNFNFAKKTGAREIYLWGAEWWYWLMINEKDDRLWIMAKQLIAQNN